MRAFIFSGPMSTSATLGRLFSGPDSCQGYLFSQELRTSCFLARFSAGVCRLLVFLSAVLTISSSGNAEAKLSSMEQMFSFGDSNNDIGNSALITYLSSGSFSFPPPPNYNGRASNGPLAHEYLWKLFNPSSPGLLPSYLGGTNYAVSGATTGLANFNLLSPLVPDGLKSSFQDLGVSAQLNRFLIDQHAFNRDTTLFYISSFPNDVMYWLFTSQATGGNGLDSGTVSGLPPSPIGSDQNALTMLVDNGINNTETLITTLANHGAKHFLVPNMIDLGLTPLFRHNGDPGLSSVVSQLSSSYNISLHDKFAELKVAIPGIDIISFPTDSLLADVVMHPSSYGFDNVTDSCFNVMTGDVCQNPDRWLFWDYFHPSTATQRSIGYALYGEIHATPVPAPFAAVYVAFRCSRNLRKKIRLRER